MLKNAFFRNARSSELLEIFFVSAVSSVLITRLYLEITGYPTLGGEVFHIAHMLPGGLLMLSALIISLSFLGYKVLILASLLGGVGFGLFIDELGKFITSNNDYFFQPTAALIYLIFVGLFFVFRNLAKVDRLSEREFLLNALKMIEEAVIGDLDKAERSRVLKYLKKADQSSPIVAELTDLMKRIDAIGTVRKSWTNRVRHRAEAYYRRFISTTAGVRAIDGALIAVAVWSLLIILSSVVGGKENLLDSDQTIAYASLFQLISTVVATWFIIRGVPLMQSNRLKAYDLFTRGILINLFVTQFFDFYREQFSAVWTFLVYLMIYLLLRLAVAEERRIALRGELPAQSPSSST